MSARAEVLILGGGLIGLGIGWQLAKAGRGVTVVERDRPAAARPAAASWAAAGMLAPLAEAGFNEPALLALNRASLALYPEFVAELEQDAGLGVDYRTDGTLIVAVDRDEAAWLERQHHFQRSLALPTEWLSGADARRLEPHLSPGVVAAVFSPTDHQVDNRLLWAALRQAFLNAGGTLREGKEAVRVAREGGRAAGAWVRPSAEAAAEPELLSAERTVVCAGAWSRLLLSAGDLPPDAAPPIRPVKGQMLALSTSDLFSVDRVVRTRRVYLVPKGDGRLVVGATSEEVGFDTRLTAGGVLELLRDAWEVMPGVYDLPLLDTWAGLRPASRDNAPILGTTPVERLYIAAGHYRNGVLLTPVTARAMSELLLSDRVPDVIRPFALDRFHSHRRA